MALDPPVFHIVIVIIRAAAVQGGFAEAVSAVFFYGSAEKVWLTNIKENIPIMPAMWINR